MSKQLRSLRVKVCGVTNVDDAMMCAEAGVQMIGLNFARESRRRITLEEGAQIISAVRDRHGNVEFAGVFVNEDLAALRGTADRLALEAVQLHGEEPPEYARALRERTVIKAFPVGPGYSERIAAAYPSDAVLLDGWSGAARGGTGATFDWSVAASLRPRIPRLILAGGLTSANVSEAISEVRPDVLDVCSGIEEMPGRKNPEKLHRFLDAVRRAISALP